MATPLHAQEVSPPVALDNLAGVLDHDGAAVTADALRGHWTVMWFYPKAATGG